MTGSGNVIDSRRTGWARVAQRVAGERLLQADGRDDVAGEDRVDVLAVVRVHLQQAADALLAVRRRRSGRPNPPASVPEYTRR